MKINEYKADIKRYLSEIDLNAHSSIIDHAVFLELIINGPFALREEDGRFYLYEIKARVGKYRGLEFRINPNEHPPPHFHVHTGKFEASFRIKDCSHLAGEISDMDYRKIKYWYSKSKPKLIETWNATRPTNCIVGKYRE